MCNVCLLLAGFVGIREQTMHANLWTHIIVCMLNLGLYLFSLLHFSETDVWYILKGI